MVKRTLTTDYRNAIESVATSEVDLIFLTLSHPQLTEPIRVVRDTVDYVRGGVTWTGFPFRVSFLSDDDRPPRAELEVQNVDRIIGETVKSLTKPLRVRHELLHSSDFDTTVDPRVELSSDSAVEYDANFLFLRSVSVDDLAVRGELVGWDFSQLTWPGARATKELLPGLAR